MKQITAIPILLGILWSIIAFIPVDWPIELIDNLITVSAIGMWIYILIGLGVPWAKQLKNKDVRDIIIGALVFGALVFASVLMSGNVAAIALAVGTAFLLFKVGRVYYVRRKTKVKEGSE